MTRKSKTEDERIESESHAAHRFRDEYGEQVRFVPERSEWIYKVGKSWEWDRSNYADSLVRSLLDRQHDQDVKWRGSSPTIRHVKTIAQSDPALQASMEEIDARPFLIGTPTNVFNIKKHQFVTPRSGTYVTRRTTVDPDFGKDCLRFKRFLKEICEGDHEVIAYIRRWCGYVLTGSTKEQALLVVYGPGGNGKSVLVNTLATIMGDYHKEAAAETFVETKAFRHETALAHVAGARFVTSGETDQDGGWNEATMKRAVGGDPVTARFLYRNPFTYRPCYKIWVTTNHLPRLKSVGPAMRRRIHVLELNYVPKRPDPDLEEKLAGEHGAILAWMLEGAREWLKEGLNPPKSVVAATNQYFAEQDVMGMWLDQKTRMSDSAKTQSSILCDSYNRFLKGRNLPEVHPSVFGRLMGARGFRSVLAKAHSDAERQRCYLGIRLRMNA
jgi:putative DNA primase/helicase